MWKGKGAPEWPKAPHLFLFQECSSRCAWEGGNPRREPGCPGVEHSDDSAEGPSPTPSARGFPPGGFLPANFMGPLSWAGPGAHTGGEGSCPGTGMLVSIVCLEVHPEPCPLM